MSRSVLPYLSLHEPLLREQGDGELVGPRDGRVRVVESRPDRLLDGGRADPVYLVRTPRPHEAPTEFQFDAAGVPLPTWRENCLVPCTARTCRRWVEAALAYATAVDDISAALVAAHRRARSVPRWRPLAARRALPRMEEDPAALQAGHGRGQRGLRAGSPGDRAGDPGGERQGLRIRTAGSRGPRSQGRPRRTADLGLVEGNNWPTDRLRLPARPTRQRQPRAGFAAPLSTHRLAGAAPGAQGTEPGPAAMGQDGDHRDGARTGRRELRGLVARAVPRGLPHLHITPAEWPLVPQPDRWHRYRRNRRLHRRVRLRRTDTATPRSTLPAVTDDRHKRGSKGGRPPKFDTCPRRSEGCRLRRPRKSGA